MHLSNSSILLILGLITIVVSSLSDILTQDSLKNRKIKAWTFITAILIALIATVVQHNQTLNELNQQKEKQREDSINNQMEKIEDSLRFSQQLRRQDSNQFETIRHLNQNRDSLKSALLNTYIKLDSSQKALIDYISGETQQPSITFNQNEGDTLWFKLTYSGVSPLWNVHSKVFDYREQIDAMKDDSRINFSAGRALLAEQYAQKFANTENTFDALYYGDEKTIFGRRWLPEGDGLMRFRITIYWGRRKIDREYEIEYVDDEYDYLKVKQMLDPDTGQRIIEE